jgi:hypothetical protein
MSIFIGGTGSANELDDYEEGEYTPSLSSGQSLRSDFDRLKYTKIGRQVTLTGQLVFNQYNSSSYNVYFQIGLPFANGQLGGDRSDYVMAAGTGFFATSGSNSPNNNIQPMAFYITNGSSVATVYGLHPNYDSTTGNWVGNGSDVWVNLTYFTD